MQFHQRDALSGIADKHVDVVGDEYTSFMTLIGCSRHKCDNITLKWKTVSVRLQKTFFEDCYYRK